MDKLKLEPTAALVMQWGKTAFANKTLQKFIHHLDLSSGKELYEKCSLVCDWYEEVILNRKYFISNFIHSEISKSKEEHLVINLAAGKSPLALEILEKNFDNVDLVLEVDVAGMDEKKELYDKLFPQYSEKIKCVTADITSQSILKLLNNLLHEYYNDHNCIIVLEGITYYLNMNDIENIVASFKSPQKNNLLIFEYMVPNEMVSEKRKEIPQKVFDIIKSYSGLNEISTYSFEKVSEMFGKNGAKLRVVNCLKEIEKARKGDNKYFHNTDDGWIECAVWQL